MSFGWLGTFRQGSWKALRSFVLQERQDVGRRLSVIRAELRRIGSIAVNYLQEVDEVTGDVRVTETRVGFTVTHNSSLERLVQAYVAMGGNPLDISHFFIPDRNVVTAEDTDGFSTVGQEYPLGGVAYPRTAEPNEPENSWGPYPGGFIPLQKYIPGRVGGRKDLDSGSESIVNSIIALRNPVSQEIRRKRNDMEARIIKLCDLREQLLKERDTTLVQAFGGLSESLTEFDAERFAQVLRVPRITQMVDTILFVVDEDGFVDFSTTNSAEILKYENLLVDVLPDEANTAL
jgi:hypothetical protein